ncbi:MAG: T9SS type A sorting domain-containing protein, partial [Calditrichaeota bacterium]|nr:T9SS type A sorting domain-containing protein [Calditrichota bacterium]
NYPNPFNPSTIIRFQLTHASDVKLHIYNMLGQEIKTLLDAQQPAGEHRIIWNGQNENGEPGASGVYLLRMESGHFQQTRKLLLLR